MARINAWVVPVLEPVWLGHRRSADIIPRKPAGTPTDRRHWYQRAELHFPSAARPTSLLRTGWSCIVRKLFLQLRASVNLPRVILGLPEALALARRFQLPGPCPPIPSAHGKARLPLATVHEPAESAVWVADRVALA
jgi:hypothetical protein